MLPVPAAVLRLLVLPLLLLSLGTRERESGASVSRPLPLDMRLDQWNSPTTSVPVSLPRVTARSISGSGTEKGCADALPL